MGQLDHVVAVTRVVFGAATLTRGPRRLGPPHVDVGPRVDSGGVALTRGSASFGVASRCRGAPRCFGRGRVDARLRIVWGRVASTDNWEPRDDASAVTLIRAKRLVPAHVDWYHWGAAHVICGTLQSLRGVASFGGASRQLARRRDRSHVDSSRETFGAPWRQLARALSTWPLSKRRGCSGFAKQSRLKLV